MTDQNRQIAEDCWSYYDTNNPGVTPGSASNYIDFGAAYPSAPAIPFLSGYAVTDDPAAKQRYRLRAEQQLDYVMERRKDDKGVVHDGFLLIPGLSDSKYAYISADTQARVIFNTYVAYKIFQDVNYFHRAVEFADGAVRALPRGTGSSADVFTTERFKVIRDVPPPDPTTFPVDVNQTSGIGLALCLLAADPTPFRDNVFMTKRDCQRIGLNNIWASMQCQDPDGGVWLTQTDHRLDTFYGSYSTFLWTWVMQLDIFNDRFGVDYSQKKAAFADSVLRSGSWLSGRMDSRRGTDRFYASTATELGQNLPTPPTEFSWRLPLYWYCGTRGTDHFTRQMFHTLAIGCAGPTETMAAPWAYYLAMGFDLSRLLV
jgi:hypothetical protein